MNRKKRNWTPYLLLLPSLLYLALFFAWPMVRSLSLAFWKEDARLSLHTEADLNSPVAGSLPQASTVTILDTQGNAIEDATHTDAITEVWYHITATDAAGQPVEGWVHSDRVRVDEEDEETGVPTLGRIRAVRRSGADPQTSVFVEPGSTRGEVVAKLDAQTEVNILEQTILEVWYQVSGVVTDGQILDGWAQSAYITRGEQDPSSGFVQSGDTAEWTLDFVQTMLSDRFFTSALVTTLLLTLITVPIQFVVALVMALVIQARLKGNLLFLYIFSIPLGVSELAVGIVFFLLFTERGYLNSFLQGLGLINSPITFISASTRHWIIVAIVLAEVWRATSIVMVILVSGLQAVPTEFLEAAELFGAGLRQRIRHIILPLLKPSIQVALILRTILAFQVFAVVMAISGGDIVTTLSRETYRWYSEDIRNPNLAASYAGLIMLISIVTAIFYLRAVRTQQEAMS
jgi:multiple sugar transport system permease protein